jgi:chemotaxis protein CheD
MGQLVVDIADFAVSNDVGTTLITYSLGSCIGVVVWDPVVHVGGMLHYMLPESSLSPEKAKSSPAMFCDTGVPRLFKAAYELGAEKKRLVVKVAGGSLLLDDNGTFNIGKRNYLALRRCAWTFRAVP